MAQEKPVDADRAAKGESIQERKIPSLGGAHLVRQPWQPATSGLMFHEGCGGSWSDSAPWHPARLPSATREWMVIYHFGCIRPKSVRILFTQRTLWGPAPRGPSGLRQNTTQCQKVFVPFRCHLMAKKASGGRVSHERNCVGVCLSLHAEVLRSVRTYLVSDQSRES